MVAYSFKKRFVEPIRAGTKRQTIRSVGKRRHARVGEDLQLYHAMRTRHCFKIIPDPICSSAVRVRINFGLGTVVLGPDGGPLMMKRDELDAFAILDGFESWEEMDAFWKAEHPDERFFDGLLTGW